MFAVNKLGVRFFFGGRVRKTQVRLNPALVLKENACLNSSSWFEVKVFIETISLCVYETGRESCRRHGMHSYSQDMC